MSSKAPEAISVPFGPAATVSALAYRAVEPTTPATLLLAHGAGADQRSAFMVSFSRDLASLGLNVVTFNFPYTEQRRRVPDKQPVLEACYRSVIDAVGARMGTSHTMFIGGKSMGGRIATHVASSAPTLAVAGLVLLGYPLHAPGRPDVRRDAHLKDVKRPMLIVQGSRDAFGTPSELTPVLARLPVPATLHVVDGGDHSFKLSKSGQPAQTETIRRIQSAVVEWIGQITKGGRGSLPGRG